MPARFLYQMDHLGEENYVPNPVLEKALDVLFLLHADHELNASSTTVLQTGSSLVDPYSAIAWVPFSRRLCVLFSSLSLVLGVHRYSEFISSTLICVLTCDSKRASPWSVIAQAMLSDLFDNKRTGGANEAVIRMLVSIGRLV